MIVHTADTALRLARCFGTTDRFWLNLQTDFDLETQKDHLGTAVDRIEPLRTAYPLARPILGGRTTRQPRGGVTLG